MVIHDELTELIIGAALDVHRCMGPGLLEQTYEQCLAWELRQSGLSVEQEVPLPVIYKTVRLELGYRVDLIVEGAAVVEVKAVERVHPVHHAQLLTYLKLTGLTRGLLLNFCVPRMKDGIHRVVLDYPELRRAGRAAPTAGPSATTAGPSATTAGPSATTAGPSATTAGPD